jgi:FixJ family two-component response regulator
MELQRRLLAAESSLSVVVVTGVADVPTAVAAMKYGAVTLLEKPYCHDELLRAVERGLATSLQRWRRRQDEQAILQRLAKLSDEERGVMECLLAGKSNKQIAHKLDLSMRTVDRRRHAVLEKMGVNSVTKLALRLSSTPLAESRAADARRAAQ